MNETQADTKRAGLASTAQMVQAAVIVAGFLAVAAGAVMAVVGKFEDEGGFRDAGYVYDLRTPGIILAGMALLSAPVAWLIAYAVQVWAEQ